MQFKYCKNSWAIKTVDKIHITQFNLVHLNFLEKISQNLELCKKADQMWEKFNFSLPKKLCFAATKYLNENWRIYSCKNNEKMKNSVPFMTRIKKEQWNSHFNTACRKELGEHVNHHENVIYVVEVCKISVIYHIIQKCMLHPINMVT